MQKIGKNLFIFHIFLFARILVLSEDTLPCNNLLQPPGHAVHELPVPVFLARTGMSQNSPQGLHWHVALFPGGFQGHLGLPQSNGHLFFIT